MERNRKTAIIKKEKKAREKGRLKGFHNREVKENRWNLKSLYILEIKPCIQIQLKGL